VNLGNFGKGFRLLSVVEHDGVQGCHGVDHAIREVEQSLENRKRYEY
jgi:hypothetical protein